MKGFSGQVPAVVYNRLPAIQLLRFRLRAGGRIHLANMCPSGCETDPPETPVAQVLVKIQ